MSRPKDKSLDPAWQDRRRKSRHKVRSAVTVRMTEEERDRCHWAAEREGLTIQAWGLQTLLAAAASQAPAPEALSEKT